MLGQKTNLSKIKQTEIMYINYIYICVCVYIYIYIYIMSNLYILEINPLSVTSLANISSHSEGSLLLCLFYFVLFIVSHAVQNLLSLIRSQLLNNLALNFKEVKK